MVDAIIGVALGLGLAAAAGLRIFVPVLGAGLAAHFGVVALNPAFAWVGTIPALIAFGTASALEIGAYYVPWLDHVLDIVATPTAVGAGILASAAVVTDLPPLVTWVVAIVGGGGAAGLVQMLSVAARVKSTLTTGGLANSVVATGETVGAASITALAIFVPVIALLFLILAGVLMLRITGRLRRSRDR